MATRTRDPFDPAYMSADERLAELASILAKGVLRIHERGALAPSAPPRNSHADRLELLSERPLDRGHG